MNTDTGLELGPKSLSASIDDFAKEKDDYYASQFGKIQGKTGFAWSWNWAAALGGPLWGAFRGLWGFFWTFLVLELFALVQLGRGLWGDLGADTKSSRQISKSGSSRPQTSWPPAIRQVRMRH